jgi:hypothetical protein
LVFSATGSAVALAFEDADAVAVDAWVTDGVLWAAGRPVKLTCMAKLVSPTGQAPPELAPVPDLVELCS